MDASKIDHKLIRFVPAVGDYSNSIGNCETHGPAWDVHFIPDFLFWPPIAKRVCDRPCLTHGHRCHPSCCETRCINRYVWQCNFTSFNHIYMALLLPTWFEGSLLWTPKCLQVWLCLQPSLLLLLNSKGIFSHWTKYYYSTHIASYLWLLVVFHVKLISMKFTAWLATW